MIAPSPRKKSIDSAGTTSSAATLIETTETTEPTIKMDMPPGRPPPPNDSKERLRRQFPEWVTTSRPSFTREEMARWEWEARLLEESRERYERTIKDDLEKEIRDRMTKTSVW